MRRSIQACYGRAALDCVRRAGAGRAAPAAAPSTSTATPSRPQAPAPRRSQRPPRRADYSPAASAASRSASPAAAHYAAPAAQPTAPCRSLAHRPQIPAPRSAPQNGAELRLVLKRYFGVCLHVRNISECVGRCCSIRANRVRKASICTESRVSGGVPIYGTQSPSGDASAQSRWQSPIGLGPR